MKMLRLEIFHMYSYEKIFHNSYKNYMYCFSHLLSGYSNGFIDIPFYLLEW